MEIFEKILQFMGVLSIPSIGWNIFQYRNKKKMYKIELGRDITLKEIELEEMKNRHNEERVNLESNYEGFITDNERVYVDHRTENDKRKSENLFKRHVSEDKKLYAEIIYLQKLNGENFDLILKETMFKKIIKIFKLK